MAAVHPVTIYGPKDDQRGKVSEWMRRVMPGIDPSQTNAIAIRRTPDGNPFEATVYRFARNEAGKFYTDRTTSPPSIARLPPLVLPVDSAPEL